MMMPMVHGRLLLVRSDGDKKTTFDVDPMFWGDLYAALSEVPILSGVETSHCVVNQRMNRSSPNH